MTNASCENGVNDAEWDGFVGSNWHGYHEQSSAYARVRGGYGFDCARAVVREGGQIVAGAQVQEQATPVGRFAVVLRGPLARDEDLQLFGEVVRSLETLAKRRGYVSMRVDTLPTQTAAIDALEAAGFTASDAWAKRLATVVTPLDCSDAAMLERMDRKTRYNVRRAEREGVTVREGEACTIDEFFHLREMTAEHQQFITFPQWYFESMWNVFGTTGRGQLLMADHGGSPIAAMFNVVAGGRLYFMWVGMHRGEAQRKLCANYLLHAHAMRWGRDHGCTHYDMIGISTNKKKFAHEEIHWPQPRRRFFGPLRQVREAALNRSWPGGVLHKVVMKASRRLKLKPRMPY